MKREIDGKMAGRVALLAALSCAAMFAQGPISDVAAGVSQEVTLAVRYVAILAVIGLGATIYFSHQHGIAGRVAAGLIGLFIALNPTPVANWIQGLHG